MLSAVLSKEECAKCKFCCSFRRCSLWETPKFSEAIVTYYANEQRQFVSQDDSYRMNLIDLYQTDKPEEEVACYFLEDNKGCTLPAEHKPFECKIWPLRVMRKNDKTVIALSNGCRAMNEEAVIKLNSLLKEGLAAQIYEYADKHPEMIEEYNEDYRIMC